MKETPEARKALDEEVSLSYEGFRPQVDSAGDPLTTGPNNMWMNCLLAPDDADDFIKAQMQGRVIAERVTDPADRQRIDQLLEEHTQAATTVMDDREARKKFILGDDCNKRLYEIYKIARKYGVSHDDLFR